MSNSSIETKRDSQTICFIKGLPATTEIALSLYLSTNKSIVSLKAFVSRSNVVISWNIIPAKTKLKIQSPKKLLQAPFDFDFRHKTNKRYRYDRNQRKESRLFYFFLTQEPITETKGNASVKNQKVTKMKENRRRSKLPGLGKFGITRMAEAILAMRRSWPSSEAISRSSSSSTE